jgi:hypothetical protein
MLGRISAVIGFGALVLVMASCSSDDSGGGAADGGGKGGSGGSSQGGSSQGGSSQGGSSQGGSSQGGSGGGSNDAHQICVDKINALRATKGLTPLERATDKEACVTTQSTTDEQNNDPHGTFGDCDEGGQNECLGSGSNGIEGCLDSMWGEKDQAGCSGCDACADGYNPNCPNCDFYGDSTGDVCGHYVNMSAKYFTKVACGFSTAGGWATIDFY